MCPLKVKTNADILEACAKLQHSVNRLKPQAIRRLYSNIFMISIFNHGFAYVKFIVKDSNA